MSPTQDFVESLIALFSMFGAAFLFVQIASLWVTAALVVGACVYLFIRSRSSA